MDLVVDYSSPIIFSALAALFFAFFIFFRNFHFRLNSLCGAFGILVGVWFWFLYSFSQNQDYHSLVYSVALGGLALYFILLIFHSLEILKSKTKKLIPDKALFLPAWISYFLAGEVILVALSLSVFALISSFPPVLELLPLPAELPVLIGLLVFVLVFIFSAKVSLIGVVTFYHLVQNTLKNKFGFLEDVFIFAAGFCWLAFSLGMLLFSVRSVQYRMVQGSTRLLTEEPRLEGIAVFSLAIFALANILVLAVIVNRRYFLSWRVATAQFIASSIILFNLVSLLNSGSVEEVVLRSVLIVVLAFLSHLLVQSVVKEITKKQKVQETTKNIYHANINLKKLDRAKSDFINTASHQLRSPLSVVKGIASLIMEGTYEKISSGVKDAMEKVFISNERLIGLIESLLNVSHLEEGRVDFDFRKIDLNKIAKISAGGLILQAKNKKLFLNFIPHKSGKLLVWVDEQKLTEAISNLVDNAVKYTEKGGVTVEVKKNGPMARVEVRDTGIGIKKEEQKSLFQKFVRAGRGSKVSVVGTGLGLYVVRKMIEAHKGRIWAESPGEGRGSFFIIELPLDLPSPPSPEFVKKVVMEKNSN